ncbi:hypothetical protein MLD38_012246 [Melastoma candidum]|uniref:Uncharacterized protein n=1 Tax=Melastoma candidum TaxID=119954 RepID=A0ACB9R7I0_9MYRT|nr:hypothetical protein MLD38_012246 [Melastoma candidum]
MPLCWHVDVSAWVGGVPGMQRHHMMKTARNQLDQLEAGGVEEALDARSTPGEAEQPTVTGIFQWISYKFFSGHLILLTFFRPDNTGLHDP